MHKNLLGFIYGFIEVAVVLVIKLGAASEYLKKKNIHDFLRDSNPFPDMNLKKL